MAVFYLMVFGPVLAGVVLALLWWAVRGRKFRLPHGTVSALTVIAGLLLVLGTFAELLFGLSFLFPFEVPREISDWYWSYRFAVPLVMGIVGLVLLAFPIRPRGGSGTAELTPRTPLSYTRARWFIAPASVLTIILIATFTAGAASQPDPETGHYNMYFVDLGGERGMGTNIYGWYNSVPSLILLGLMILIAALTLFVISRPPLRSNRELDVQTRTLRTRNVFTVVTGAFLLHLAAILVSLAGTASVRSSFSTGDGSVRFWTTFAALEPVLRGASVVVVVLGFALWVAVPLSGIPLRRAKALVDS